MGAEELRGNGESGNRGTGGPGNRRNGEGENGDADFGLRISKMTEFLLRQLKVDATDVLTPAGWRCDFDSGALLCYDSVCA